MGEPCIISVAITGSVPRQKHDPVLVAQMAALAARHGRPTAAAAQARTLPGLPAA